MNPTAGLRSDSDPRNITYIPAVNPALAGLARLDLEQNSSFAPGHYQGSTFPFGHLKTRISSAGNIFLFGDKRLVMNVSADVRHYYS